MRADQAAAGEEAACPRPAPGAGFKHVPVLEKQGRNARLGRSVKPKALAPLLAEFLHQR
jgi:hypothetical protein